MNMEKMLTQLSVRDRAMMVRRGPEPPLDPDDPNVEDPISPGGRSPFVSRNGIN